MENNNNGNNGNNNTSLEAKIDEAWKRFVHLDNIYRETGKGEEERNAARDEWRLLNGLPKWEWRLE